ncbi:glycine/betaine ABC transporter substrate-binding protein [Pseudonocardia asaccharolytica DSM 44247 = NBRC 16224]|uniref:Glycine/betaine ABC transporter substrate-binding protein n=1 Tax=Pseudonocardia asaccharolytica DSM 44247 = NBRC 16224 TaxID=1123024 RepID=A0A511D712_9PSEU|nr:glycine/betaine ABC transporter substrate-binding protein [Pseudonocardia asaccharolytica DSM 44247 = NBRC 16224]
MRIVKLASRRGVRRIAAVLAGAVLTLAGCGAPGSAPAAPADGLAARLDLAGQRYVVGGKNFDEQLVLCQIAVAALESVNAEVIERCNIGGTDATRNALLAGDIQLYWEYTGIAWAGFFKQTEQVPDAQTLFDLVSQRDLAQNRIRWLPRAPFNNTYGFAVNERTAAELDLTTLSDMAHHLSSGRPGALCVETEYANRADGLRGLEQAYGFQVPPERVWTLPTDAIYQATADRDPCLFGEVFTTDGRVAALQLRVLQDDKSYHATYNAAVTIHEDAYAKAPEIAEVFAPIAAALDESAISELNRQVWAGDRQPREVVRAWLSDKGFIGAG